MNANADVEAVELAPPGAGIPSHEAWALRFGLGVSSSLISWDLSRRLFQREGRTILAVADNISDEVLHKRVLIPRIMGLEDSSRYWSPAMTLEHLIVVGDALAGLIVRLSHGEAIETPVRTEDVKPGERPSAKIIDDYREMLVRYDRRTGEEIGDRRSKTSHPHPWTGPLTAHRWLNLAALHQRVHLKQIRSILKQAERG